MPPLPDAPNVVRVSCRGTNESTRWANVFHILYTAAAVTAAELDAFSTSFATAYDTNLLEHIENEVFLTDVVATDLTTTSSPQGQWSGSYQGDYAGQPYPAQVAVCLSWHQNLRYRGGHPRTYLPGIPLAAGADNRALTPGYAAFYLANAQGFRNDVNAIALAGGTVELGALSYYSKVVTPVAPHLRPTPLFLPFTGAAVHGRLDTQRRRLGRDT